MAAARLGAILPHRATLEQLIHETARLRPYFGQNSPYTQALHLTGATASAGAAVQYDGHVRPLMIIQSARN
jgi:hypothetical protein